MIQRRKRKKRNGTEYFVWRVRWHDETGAERSRTVDTRADAEALEAKIKLAKRAGDLAALDAGKETLAEFAEEWWRLYAQPNLQMATRKNYAVVWNNYALPRLVQRRLREITPAVVVEFRASLERGGIGPQTVRKTLTMLQSMFRTAVEWERVGANPVSAVRKPSVSRQRAIQALSPVKIESLRLWLVENASPPRRRSGRRRGRARGRRAVRPAAFVRLAAHPRGPLLRRRERGAARPRADDDAQHLRPCDRRARRRGEGLGGGAHPPGARRDPAHFRPTSREQRFRGNARERENPAAAGFT